MRAVEWLKKQFLHLLPPFVFFFIAFNLLNVTEGIGNDTGNFELFSFFNVFLASVIVAKVLIVVDNLPWIDIFPEKPLIYNVLWKTWIYGFVAFIFRIAFRYLPLAYQAKSWAGGKDLFLEQVDWILFFTIQGWYFILFALFVSIRELVLLAGTDKARKSFFGF
ncbi:MAG: hypothetical protein JSS32_01715 [Verrucomicrobia bacterium]|nr:hypothetical protein [Verrucomicrobiota bacterium]